MPSSVPTRRTALAQSPDEAKLQTGLYIVATPIGNLRDITLRALDVLAGADTILAEDTRHTGKLLGAYDMKVRLISYHDHNAAGRIPAVLDWLEEGKIIALVSDAGTPLISDPGFKLVRAVRKAGFGVFPVPGASSLLAALMGAGLATDKFTFCGFLPLKTAARQTALRDLQTATGTLIFFETGPRMATTLAAIETMLGRRSIVIARELTKIHEEFLHGSPGDLMERIHANPLRGEMVLLVAPADTPATWSDAQIDAALGEHLPDMGSKRASSHVAERSGWKKRDVYVRAQNLK